MAHDKPSHEGERYGPAEHLLKLTQDTADLFATFIAAIELKPHKFGFRTYPNSFSTDEAIQTLASLKFSQSTRAPDPEAPSMSITTTTTFVFCMPRPVALNLAQHFMDARYIRNALDPSVNLFKDPGLHTLTPKGLHVLEVFIRRTGIDADHLLLLLDIDIVCRKLFRVERGPTEDEIIFAQSGIIALFRWFVGKQPNYSAKLAADLEAVAQYTQRSKGIPMRDFTNRGILGRAVKHQHCFDAVDALEWLCDFTTVIGRDEAAEVCAHFDRLGLIKLVSDSEKTQKNAIIFSVHGSASNGDSSIRSQGEFRCANKTIYQVTTRGHRIAGWVDARALETTSEEESHVVEKSISEGKKLTTAPERLRYILKERSLRAVFRDFLLERFCEEHIFFWMDVEALNRKSHVTSSAIGGPDALPADQTTSTQAKADARKHHQAVLNKALVIYKTYLEPASQYELNTDYTLRNELVKFLGTIPSETQHEEPRNLSNRILTCNGDQLRALIRHYNGIQAYTFRVMLTDSFPKFILTEKYLALQQTNDYLGSGETHNDADSILDASGTYIICST